MFRLSQESDQILFQQVMGFITLTFAVFVETALGHVSSLFGSAPKLAICLLFILTIKFPYTVTLISVFSAGLIFDLIEGNPLGFTSSLYLIVYFIGEWRQIVLSDSDAGTIWSEFVLIMFGLMIYAMVIFGLYEGHLPPFSEMLFQVGLTILIFPILNWVIDLYRNIGLYFGGGR